MSSLFKTVHAARTNVDWSRKHARYVRMWDRPTIIRENRAYDESTYRDYRRWFQQEGLYTVFLKGQVVSSYMHYYVFICNEIID